MLAVATPEVLWWALLPVLFLSIGGLLLLTVASVVRRLPDAVPQAWTVVTGLAVLVACVPMWHEVRDGGPRSTLAGSVAVDGSTVLVTALLAAVVVAVALLARPYLSREDLPGVEVYVLLMLSASGGIVMASADDLIVLFLGLEILSIAVYVMAALHLRRIESQEGAMKYFVLGAFASAFLLYGMALVYGATGSTRLALVAEYLSTTVLVSDGMLLAGIGLLLVGLSFKVAAVPFHAWTPDVYQGAPTPVVAWMAAGVKAAGFAAMVRVLVRAGHPRIGLGAPGRRAGRGQRGGRGGGRCAPDRHPADAGLLLDRPRRLPAARRAGRRRRRHRRGIRLPGRVRPAGHRQLRRADRHGR